MIQTFSATPQIDTLPNFKSWAKGISDAMTAIGWTQTADTGQVNYGTIGAVPTASVYQIFGMSDALQATAGVFVKIECWNQSGSPRIQVSFGTGTDGAGNLTGNLSDLFAQSFDPGSTAFDCWVAGTSSWFSMVMFPSAGVSDSGVPFAFACERSHAPDGTDTNEYFTVLSAGNLVKQQSIFKLGGGTVVPVESKHMAFVPTTNTSGTINSSTFFCPICPFVGQMGNPMIAGHVKSTDTLDQATLSVKFYGSAHTLIALKQSPFANMAANNGSAYCARYE